MTKFKLFALNLAAFWLTLLPWVVIAQQTDATCESDYTIQAGDWLSKIAEKAYGDPLAYPLIVDATNAQATTDDTYTPIDNANLIEPGWTICVPPQTASSPPATDSAATIDFTWPLTDGATWTYQVDRYDTYEGEAITATYQLVVTATTPQNDNTYRAAQLTEKNTFLSGSVDTEWLAANPGYLDGVGSEQSYWLVQTTAGIYQQFGNLNPATLETDGFLLYKLPLTTGESWYSDPGQRAEFTDIAAGPDPGKATLSMLVDQQTPAGSYSACYQVETFFNNGNTYDIICQDVGLIGSRLDHQGSPFGYATTLTNFQP